MALSIPALVFTIIQFIVFLFVLIATPLPMFRSKTSYWGIHTCRTLWGATTKCYGSVYSSRGATAFGCDRRTSIMQCAQVFAIISILTTVCAFVLGVLMVVEKVGAVGPLIVTIVSVVTIVVCWGCVVNVMTVEMCGITIGDFEFSTTNYAIDYDYAAGFGLMITAWFLELVGLLFIVHICIQCMEKGDQWNQEAAYEAVQMQDVPMRAQPANKYNLES